MIRAVANLLLLLLPCEFIGNAHTMQIRADLLDKRRGSAKADLPMKAGSGIKQLNATPVRVLRPIA
jgi:hypothetical protein